MAFEQRSLDDYVDVAERMTEFYERFPEGSLRMAEPWQQAIVEGYDKDGQRVAQTFIVYTAAAYRTPDDQAPGIGIAWEIFPGRTNFTRGSEIMNAETSAWGRAMAALGIATKRGIASRQEVQAARDREDGLPTNRDGSLSRSRTTDEQKAAAGVETDAERKAHTDLAKPPPNTQAVNRLSTTPEDDPWQRPAPVRAKPAGWLLSERFADLGVIDRQERLEQCAEIIGRPVGSSSELEPGEVAAILEALQKRELAS